MLLPMFGRSVAPGLLLLFSLACGGRMEEPPVPPKPVDNGGSGGMRNTGGALPGGRGGTPSMGGATAFSGRAGTGEPGYVDPGCPDAPPPPARVECDPLDSEGTCPGGQGCYPFVDHPFGRGCSVASFGAVCARSGTGRQGDACGDGTSGCAPGFLCVVGSRSGRRCAQICTFDGDQECPAGLLCSDTDVQDYGVCS